MSTSGDFRVTKVEKAIGEFVALVADQACSQGDIQEARAEEAAALEAFRSIVRERDEALAEVERLREGSKRRWEAALRQAQFERDEARRLAAHWKKSSDYFRQRQAGTLEADLEAAAKQAVQAAGEARSAGKQAGRVADEATSAARQAFQAASEATSAARDCEGLALEAREARRDAPARRVPRQEGPLREWQQQASSDDGDEG